MSWPPFGTCVSLAFQNHEILHHFGFCKLLCTCGFGYTSLAAWSRMLSRFTHVSCFCFIHMKCSSPLAHTFFFVPGVQVPVSCTPESRALPLGAYVLRWFQEHELLLPFVSCILFCTCGFGCPKLAPRNRLLHRLAHALCLCVIHMKCCSPLSHASCFVPAVSGQRGAVFHVYETYAKRMCQPGKHAIPGFKACVSESACAKQLAGAKGGPGWNHITSGGCCGDAGPRPHSAGRIELDEARTGGGGTPEHT
jgi:hypothetical protein